MKISRYTEGQTVKARREEVNGQSVIVFSCELGINKQTFYNWKKKYAGMSSEHIRQLKQLEEQNQRLKQMYAVVSSDKKMLKNVLSKKW